MKFKSDLIEGTIQNRYKRFFADIKLPSGEVVIAHCPNTGSMKTCWEPGWKAFITSSDDPKRKLKYTLELIQNEMGYISVNTGVANKIVKEALEAGIIKEVSEYKKIRPEQNIFDSRLDFLLQQDGLPNAYIEVKNVTLKGPNEMALFPDSVSTRGQKHLRDLIKIKEAGHRAIMLYLVNRSDVNSFAPAADIDPEYTRLLKAANKAGVEILAYQTEITTEYIKVNKKVDIQL